LRSCSALFGVLILILVSGCDAKPDSLTFPHSAAPVSGIAFVTERNGNRDIYLIQPDGTGLTPLLVSPEPDSDPAFSPDGTMIAFRSRRDGSSELFLAAADGTGEWLNLVNDPADSADDEFYPAWHPTGNLLAVFTDRFLPPIGDCTGILGVHHISFIPLDTSEPVIQHFDDLPGEQNSLTWSSDGRALAFSSICTGEFVRLYVWDQETKVVTPLTEDWYSAYTPAYSPDGKWLAFSADRDGSPNIFLMDLQSGEMHNLTQSEFTDSHPTWSPDSQWIAFTRNLGGNDEIYMINVDGGEAQNLTNNPSPDLFPAWSPGVVNR
jgi:Tol biopolymer transport system component